MNKGQVQEGAESLATQSRCGAERERERERESEREKEREKERKRERKRERERECEREKEREREQCEAFALQPASSTSPGFRGTKENKVVWVRTLDRPSSGNELRPFAS